MMPPGTPSGAPGTGGPQGARHAGNIAGGAEHAGPPYDGGAGASNVPGVPHDAAGAGVGFAGQTGGPGNAGPMPPGAPSGAAGAGTAPGTNESGRHVGSPYEGGPGDAGTSDMPGTTSSADAGPQAGSPLGSDAGTSGMTGPPRDAAGLGGGQSTGQTGIPGADEPGRHAGSPYESSAGTSNMPGVPHDAAGAGAGHGRPSAVEAEGAMPPGAPPGAAGAGGAQDAGHAGGMAFGAEHAGSPHGGGTGASDVPGIGTAGVPAGEGVSGRPGAGPPGAAGAGPALRAVEPQFEPGNRIDQELYEAALGADSDAFLRVLLNANVLVPIPEAAPLEVTPMQREFRWDAALRGESAVQVFTSLVRLREVLPESRFVYADFRELIGAWPRDDWAMLVNPGTRIGASLQGDQVRALSEWAVRVGLVPARPEVPPPPRPEAVPARPEAVPAQLPTDLDDPVSSPTIMQKVVPHGHVAWYLEQGYDRVGGFVHSTSDVADLQTPGQLYEALGLLYDGSPFSPADEGVYVIRWPAYCPDLYRIPFGGRDEAEMAAWGDAGWVVERPPFLGGGFAPGSAGSIREYKVDSVRLPYGAEMYYLGRDRSERFVAMYDPDRLAWLRPETNGREAQ